tara:strand:+ start:897 stop:1832 length:936 start_codon:yes stop_codon:yes gene_type:complete
MDYSVLIAGSGSIGSRHRKNLQSIGIDRITTCDPVAEADYKDLVEAINAAKPDVLFVCSPSKFHIEQALIGAKANAHLFIEKPLSNSLDGINELKAEVAERNLTCMVGCNMRFLTGPSKVKELIDARTIGAITEATVYAGSYLPDWRPQSDYKQSYSADPVQGGAILDMIHEIDLALWYFGSATLANTKLQTAESIGLSTEGTADLTLEHASGCTSNVHLSYMEKDYKRFCDIKGESGSIRWDINEKKVEVLDVGGTITDSYPEPSDYDFNQCYIDEITHFFDCISFGNTPQGNLDDASCALEIALAAKHS